MLRRTGLTLALLTLAGAAYAEEDKPKTKAVPAPAVTQSKVFQMAMYKEISGSSGAIDTCTAKYVDAFPENEGAANVWFSLSEDGAVAKAKVTTSLNSQDNLRRCLRDIALGWKFPKIGPNKVESTIKVHVKKGVKFEMIKPGQKPGKEGAGEGKGS